MTTRIPSFQLSLHTLHKERFIMVWKQIPTLNDIEDLETVRFGHQYPRHGLKLLHWLVNDWILFNNVRTIYAGSDPTSGNFGFHPFHNSESILPPAPAKSSYFEVGNLHKDGAHSLPFEEEETGSSQSNTDRIIVRLDPGDVIGQVYITEHTPGYRSFSAEDTYSLSKSLIQSVKHLSLIEFQRQAGYVRNTPAPQALQSARATSSRDSVCNCTIL